MKAVRGRLSSLLVVFFFGLRDLGPVVWVIFGGGVGQRDTLSKHGHEYGDNHKRQLYIKNIYIFRFLIKMLI